ncbi:MAG: TIGR02757 family protein [Chitinophagaceae bacterium]|nr:MAG: TIGR02757 family protein [Chitinophagaceae bacterium]
MFPVHQPSQKLRDLLENRHDRYNRPDFIAHDPVSVPHRFSKKEDIEISGFFAAILAWGQRKTIINKANELMALFGNAPHQFMLHHSDDDLKSLLHFKHRTFNTTDLLYFVAFFRHFYSLHQSLEEAFLGLPGTKNQDAYSRLVRFHDTLFGLDFAPNRSRKHVSTPARNSACKRINMYLRWMVRNDSRGVDFGIWKSIKSSELICPCDVHVDRVARNLGLISRPKPDWKTAAELTQNLALYDPTDPVKYDFALFGLGIEEGYT